MPLASARETWSAWRSAVGEGVPTDPWVIEIDPRDGTAFGLFPERSMAILVADLQSSLLQDLTLAAAHRDEALLREWARTVRRKSSSTVSSDVSIAGAVELEYHGRSVATVVVDAAIGFAFVELPYDGGIVDRSAFRARTFRRHPGAFETILLIPRRVQTDLEKHVNAMTAHPTDGMWFGAVIYNFVKDVIHDVEHVGKDVVHAIVHDAPDVAEGLAEADQAEGDDDDTEAQSVAMLEPGASDRFALSSAEPDIAALIDYRNRVLRSQRR